MLTCGEERISFRYCRGQQLTRNCPVRNCSLLPTFLSFSFSASSSLFSFCAKWEELGQRNIGTQLQSSQDQVCISQVQTSTKGAEGGSAVGSAGGKQMQRQQNQVHCGQHYPLNQHNRVHSRVTHLIHISLITYPPLPNIVRNVIST